MTRAAEVRRQDPFRFLQALRLLKSAKASLVVADSPWSPTMGLLLGSVFPASCAVAVWEGRRAVALAQMAHQAGREQWEVMHLAIADVDRCATGAAGTARARLLTLLDEVCRVAGSRKITGIIVRVPVESDWIETFRLAGFLVNMQEHVYAQPHPHPARTASVPGLRLQEKRDVWPLHQLYLRSTPQIVRLSEGRTVRDWQVRRSASRLSFQVTRWVVAGGDGLTGWLTETPGRSGDLRVQIGVVSGERELARDLLAVALGHAKEGRYTRVWSRVPAHATDIHHAFSACGFAETRRDLVLKRSLAIRVRETSAAQASKGVARDGLTSVQFRRREIYHRSRSSSRTDEDESARMGVSMLDGS